MPDRTFQDIEAFVDQCVPESLTLDYKGDFTKNLDHAKVEFPKDVAAFANSQGGLLILGVDEKNTVPQRPIEGVPDSIGKTSIRDWLEQVLNQGIAQRVTTHIQAIPHPNKPGHCIVVVEIPPSPRAPHMVISPQASPHYLRYFKRHQVQSLAAAEYEVREMFMRSLRFRDEVESYLAGRNYLTPNLPNYCMNPLTHRLRDGWRDPQAVQSFAVLVATPTIPTPHVLDFNNQAVKQWFGDALGRLELGQHHRTVFDGRVYFHAVGDPEGMSIFWRNAWLFLRGGGIEYATATPFLRSPGEPPRFHLLTLMERLRAFLIALRELAEINKQVGTFRILCNVAGLQGHTLCGFARGWRDYPDYFHRETSLPALDQDIQIVHEMDYAELSDDTISRLLWETDLRLEEAFAPCEYPRTFYHQDFKQEELRGKFGGVQY